MNITRSNDTTTIVGLVATTPRYLTLSDGSELTSFRLASAVTFTKYDGTTSEDTNWYTVSLHGDLAVNAAASINKGDRIIVSGALRIRDWESTDRSGTTVELVASVVGHDLNWGKTAYTRTHTTLTKSE